MRRYSIIVLTLIVAAAVAPAEAKHKQAVAADIFSLPSDQKSQTPLFVRNGKPLPATTPAPGAEEPNWDNAKNLPDMTGDQAKAINKVQDSSRKNVAMIRNEIASAEQKLKDLKAHKPIQLEPDALASAAPFLNPDGSRYMGPLLAEPGMSEVEQQAESADDVQARIDSLKQEITDINKDSAGQLRKLLTAHQIEELSLMRQGKLVLQQPDIIASSDAGGKSNQLVATPSSGKTQSAPVKQSSGLDKAGAKVLKSVLRLSEHGLLGYARGRI